MKNSKQKAKEVTIGLREVFNNFIENNKILIPNSLLKDANQIVLEIETLKNSAKSPSGFTLDFHAPSIWHATTYLQVTYLLSRSKDYEISQIPELIDEANFGAIFLYRGQTLPWNIIPSKWRYSDYKETILSDFQVKIFGDYINKFMKDEDAVEFDLFGRLDKTNKITALAQHYGLKTNYVDFTFDPMVAAYFASLDDSCQINELVERKGIIYFSPFLKVVMSSNIEFALPPIHAQRLLKQSGFFIDFGEPPKVINNEMDYSEKWMYLQQNCCRLFFDRSYPSIPDEDKIFFEKYIMPTDLFLAELTDNIITVSSTEDVNVLNLLSSLEEMRKQRPSWAVKDIDKSFIYTNEYFIEMAKVLERYLKITSLVLMKGKPVLDLLVTKKIMELTDEIYTAIININSLPFCNVFDGIRDIIFQTVDLLVKVQKSLIEHYEITNGKQR